MSIADRIAVMDNAHIAQVGGPRELYDRPANPFVAGFLGAVSRLGDRLVRPHDIAIATDELDGGLEAMVKRVIHLGFEVRVELMLTDGAQVSAQLTRQTVDELELAQGDIVWLHAAPTTELPDAAPGAPAVERETPPVADEHAA